MGTVNPSCDPPCTPNVKLPTKKLEETKFSDGEIVQIVEERDDEGVITKDDIDALSLTFSGGSKTDARKLTKIDSQSESPKLMESESQTKSPNLLENGSQTEGPEVIEIESQTESPKVIDNSINTENIPPSNSSIVEH